MVDDARLGKTIDGRYRPSRLIGRGGMGAVYEAEHVGLDRSVAIKFLLGDNIDETTRERFRREARAASKIVDENVVQIFDVGQADGADYIVMELLDGEDLAHRLAAGPLAPAEATTITLQILRGLTAIHGAGILHRDIKPANIVLVPRPDGDLVKITDFGIAIADGNVKLTGTDKVVGTPIYMAPEQLAGDPLDERTDLYAVGLTLHEMLTGSPPHAEKTFALIAARRLNEPPPVLAADLPRAVSSVVTRALARSPADRFASAAEFAAALESGETVAADRRADETVEGSRPRKRDVEAPRRDEAPTVADAPATAADPRPRSRTAVIALAVAVITLGAVVYSLVLRPRGTVATRRDAAVPPATVDTAAFDRQLAMAREAVAHGKLETALGVYRAILAASPPPALAAQVADELSDLVRHLDERAATPSPADAGVADAAAAFDAGVAAVTGKPKAKGQACQCTSRLSPSSRAMCPKLGKLQCACEWELMNTCPVPFTACDASEDQCRDGFKCADPGWGKYPLSGANGDACKGYLDGVHAGAVTGRLSCLYCQDQSRYSYRGKDDGPCRGYSPDDGKLYDGALGYCRDDLRIHVGD